MAADPDQQQHGVEIFQNKSLTFLLSNREEKSSRFTERYFPSLQFTTFSVLFNFLSYCRLRLETRNMKNFVKYYIKMN